MTMEHEQTNHDDLVAEVRKRYGQIAAASGSCCGPQRSCCGGGTAISQEIGYRPEELAAVPAGADLGLGCGAPLAALAPRPGEVVLDLGSGAGLDVFLAAPAVGSTGRVIGVDMTPEMLAKAREHAVRAGHTNVEFREGRLEALPVEDASVDAVTSNCVINLVPDKTAVFQEIARVLRPGGRVVVSDIVLDGELPPALVQDLAAWVGCISGALSRQAYLDLLATAGLTNVEVLADTDYGAAWAGAAPAEAAALLARTGIQPGEIAGKVRSLTIRAVKPNTD
jgi:SAM-dependent methyltransferase